MNYQICKRCGRMFKKNGRIYCEECFPITEREYEIIMEYIRKNPDATILDIITETGVTLKSINNLVEEGSVVYVENRDRVLDEDKLSESMEKIVGKKGTFHIRRIR